MAKKRSRSSDSSSSSSDDDIPEPKKKGGPKALSSKIVVSSDSSSSSSDDDGEWNAKPKAKAKGAPRGRPAKKPAPKPVKRKQKAATDSDESNSSDDDDEPKSARARFEEKEEGEVEDNDSDNNDSDNDNDIEEFNDGFDENLMGDEEDQRKLANMTEKEREQELFNRSEKREILRTRFEIERKLRLAKKQEKKKVVSEKEKSKAKEKEKEKDKNEFAPFVDSSTRSVERRRNMEDKRKVKDAIKGLKAEREKKKLKQKLRAADVYSDSSDSDSDTDAKPSKKATKPSSSSDSSSSSSISDDDSDTDAKGKSGGDSRRRDGDWDKGRSSDAEEAEQFTFTLEHLNTIRLSRFKMEQWCHAPFFKDTILGCFVRIGAGQFAQAAAGYMVGQIVDVVDSPKVYMLGKTKTNKAIKIKHGKLPERQYRLEYISNSEFTTQEFEKWYTRMVADSCDLPSRDFVDRKKSDIQKAVNYQFSDADVEQIVAEKGKFKDKPVNFAMKKSQLMKDKEYAEQNGDHAKAMEFTKEIDRLEDQAKRLEKLRTSNIASISFINERNRMRNIQEAERAIAEAQTQAQIKDDPFTRRKCAPMMISNFNKKGEAPPGTGAPEVNNNGLPPIVAIDITAKDASPDSISLASLPALSNGTKTAKALAKPAPDTDDLFSAHDFDIKIDFELPLPSNSSANSNFSGGLLAGISNGKSANGFADTRPMANSGTHRRSLNLDEYKKKKGLI